MERRGEMDLYVVKPFYDMRHILKENMEVKALCFCANVAFDELLWSAESHKKRDRLMDRFTYIPKKQGLYKYLKKMVLKNRI